VVRNLARHGVGLTVIDPDPNLPVTVHHIVGQGTEAAPLRQAGVETAVGLVAASDNDTNNLSIAITAKEVNADLFVVVRQNRVANQVLFDAYDADFTMVPSRIVARECLALITSPLLSRFLRRSRLAGARAAAVVGQDRGALRPAGSRDLGCPAECRRRAGRAQVAGDGGGEDRPRQLAARSGCPSGVVAGVCRCCWCATTRRGTA
jgi:voltage-gated potassium channel Kch